MALPRYQPGQAKAYCEGKGWKFKQTGDQLNLETCPVCGRSGWKFYISDSKGLWDDKHASCNAKGNFFTLLRDLGDLDAIAARDVSHRRDKVDTPQQRRKTLGDYLPLEIALADDPDAQAYLTSRGLTLETARAWHLGVHMKGGMKCLAIPYVVGDEIADVKYRSLPPAQKAYFRMGGGDSILFGEHLLEAAKEEERKTLYLCEGEIDALTLWQHGYWPVLSTTTGAGSFKPRWFDIIKAFNPERLVVVYDSDVAGQEGAKHVIQKFQDEFDVKNVVLPVKDSNEFFLTHANEEFDELLAAVPEEKNEYIVSLEEALDALENKLFLGETAFDGFPSQFDEINAMMAGGYWKSQLTTLSGSSGTGKTSLLLQELFWQSEQHDVSTYLICLEMPVEMMLRKLFEHRYKVPMLELTVDHVQRYRHELERFPFRMGDHIPDVKTLEKVIRTAVKRFDAQIIAFDNLNYFVRSREHQTQEIGILTKMLKTLAIELGVSIIGVAQPKKTDTEERVMTGNDLKDASAIEQDSDNIILLHRRRIGTPSKDIGKSLGVKANKSPLTLVRVDKARYAAGGECLLFFDGAHSTYRELTVEERERIRNAQQ